MTQPGNQRDIEGAGCTLSPEQEAAALVVVGGGWFGGCSLILERHHCEHGVCEFTVVYMTSIKHCRIEKDICVLPLEVLRREKVACL